MNILMCPPKYYDVKYQINSWMDITNKPKKSLAVNQWQSLYRTIHHYGAQCIIIPPRENLPDMVFTANAGLVCDNKVVLANFAKPERKKEEKYFENFFIENNYEILKLDNNFEGNGDSFIFHDTLFLGVGSRTTLRVADKIMEFFNLNKLVPCELVKDEYYHLDTCFCPLNNKDIIFIPTAFSKKTQKMFQDFNFISLESKNTPKFICNTVVINDHLIMPRPDCTFSENKLTELGYFLHYLEMSEFIKAGGAAKCLTLKI